MSEKSRDFRKSRPSPLDTESKTDVGYSSSVNVTATENSISDSMNQLSALKSSVDKLEQLFRNEKFIPLMNFRKREDGASATEVNRVTPRSVGALVHSPSNSFLSSEANAKISKLEHQLYSLNMQLQWNSFQASEFIEDIYSEVLNLHQLLEKETTYDPQQASPSSLKLVISKFKKRILDLRETEAREENRQITINNLLKQLEDERKQSNAIIQDLEEKIEHMELFHSDPDKSRKRVDSSSSTSI